MTKRIFCLTVLVFFYCSAAYAEGFGEQKDSVIVPQDTTLINQADSIGIADTLAMPSDTTVSVPPDTLKPIHYKGFDSIEKGGDKLTRSSIERMDYRFPGDFTNSVSFGFLRSLGYVGRPSESFIYGMGNGNVGYLKDGIPVNSRFQGTYDLNMLQTEAVDSMEVISLPRSFFYNSFNQPVSVNFITRDVIDVRPYTRIRYYQGANSEGFIDGLFSAYLMKRMNTSVRFTNQAVDSSETNSTLSNWNINAKVRYMPSNFINIITVYDYSRVSVDLNGGIDYEKIQENNEPEEYNEILYDDIDAPVIFHDRYRETTGHNFSVKTLMKFSGNISTDISAYYQYYFDKFRQDEDDADTSIATIKNDNSYNTYGLKLRHLINYPFANLEVLAGYEKNDFDLDFNSSVNSFDRLYAGGKLEAVFFDDLISPSFFAKYINKDNGGTLSYGFDVSLKLNNAIKLYAGYSDVERNNFQYLTGEWVLEGFNPLQLGVNFNYSRFTGSLSYINVDYNNYALAVTSSEIDSLKQSQVTEYIYRDIKYSGLNLNGSLYLWKIMLRTNSTYYFDQSSTIKNNTPSISSFGGLYYVDSLFSGNLDLVAGINYKFYGERNYLNYDYQLLQPIYYQSTSTGYERINSGVIDPSFQLDLFVSARIRKYATIFIAYENILDEQYYVVPYYPMPASGYRIGITWEFID